MHHVQYEINPLDRSEMQHGFGIAHINKSLTSHFVGETYTRPF